MAIIFELVVNFGTNREAADAARRAALAAGPVTVGGHRVDWHAEVRRHGGPPVHVSVRPADRGQALARSRLTAAELTAVGHAMVELLRGLTGYRAAAVGWDCEPDVDIDDLEEEFAGTGAGQWRGRVLADDIRPRPPFFEPFVPGYVWVPYQGERPSTLTAD